MTSSQSKTEASAGKQLVIPACIVLAFFVAGLCFLLEGVIVSHPVEVPSKEYWAQRERARNTAHWLAAGFFAGGLIFLGASYGVLRPERRQNPRKVEP